jgi:hypothetical protein
MATGAAAPPDSIFDSVPGLPAPPDGRIDGEHGLWVEIREDSIAVHWLTAAADAGVLELVVAGAPAGTHRTPAGHAHRIAVQRPSANDRVTLRYGSAGDDPLHETTIRLQSPHRAHAEVAGVDSLYVIGDTHGAFNALQSGLVTAGLTDVEMRWTGGTRHLVLAGDMMDRGPESIAILWLLYRLEQEAADAGGAVHVMLGNHEIMVMLADLRYLHPKEQRVAELHGVPFDRMFDVRTSLLGRWLASKPAMMRIDRTLISHGGVSATQLEHTVRSFDDLLDRYMSHDLFHKWADTTAVLDIDSTFYAQFRDFFFGPNSVFWHREYVQGDAALAELDRVLRHFDVDVHVVGHTAVPGVESRYDGRLIAAHTPYFGAEMLLLVRTANGYEPFRIRAGGKPERL